VASILAFVLKRWQMHKLRNKQKALAKRRSWLTIALYNFKALNRGHAIAGLFIGCKLCYFYP
jgi:hypothetical protein